MQQTRRDGFLLTRDWRETKTGLEYEFWGTSEQGPFRIRVNDQEAVFFIPRASISSEGRRAPVSLATLGGAPVDALYFLSRQAMVASRDRLRQQRVATYESDVKPVDRFLMERFITGPMTVTGEAIEQPGFIEFVNPHLAPSDYRPKFTLASLDIETQGLSNRLYSIAVAGVQSARVFMVGIGSDTDLVRFLPDERSALVSFLDYLVKLDPDILVGWNVVDFDLSFLAKAFARHRLPFALGRGAGLAQILPPRTRDQSMIVRVPGRVVLDGITTLKTAMYSFESFSLESVAQTLLGRGKLVSHPNRVQEIDRLYREAPHQLAEYNIEDCRLVLDVFSHTRLMEFAVERARLTGLPMDRPGGSVAAFDFVYLPKLHRHGYVAPDLGNQADATSSPGGYVMDSQPGLHENVLILDFKSLYPSIIRTFHIDPLALAVPGENPIPGFEEATFSRQNFILPKIIEGLWRARDQAKSQNNKPLSQAIKILMNSFYGVLGTPGCRFFNPKLAGSITRYGQRIITESRAFIEKSGYKVIYGDTDSLFVLLGKGPDEKKSSAIGDKLAASLNEHWRNHLSKTLGLASFFEIEFETHFLRFFMPTVRGSEKGSKKRYAGLVRGPDGRLTVSFTGLESVRTDWTPLARNFQRELYRRVFLDEPYESFVLQTAQDLMAGKLDGQLIYRKRLRKPLETYLKNVPPHVRAARLQDAPGHWVSYVLTLKGPQPVDGVNSPPDHVHYLEHQLAPVADGILRILGTSFQAIFDRQMELF